MIRIGPVVSIFVISIFAIGCNGLGKQLNALNESTLKITQIVIPEWDKKCLDAATSCAEVCKTINAAASQPTEKTSPSDCKASCMPYQTCAKQRAIFYAVINGIHTSIAYAVAFLQTGEEPKAQVILAKVVSALADAYKIAMDAGFALK